MLPVPTTAFRWQSTVNSNCKRTLRSPITLGVGSSTKRQGIGLYMQNAADSINEAAAFIYEIRKPLMINAVDYFY